MNTIDIPVLLVAGAAGALLGFLFFGGLLWTIRRGVVSPHPALWFFTSLMARMSLVLIGFYFVGGAYWRRFVVCLVGFFAARVLVMWMTFRRSTLPMREAPHAPHA